MPVVTAAGLWLRMAGETLGAIGLLGQILGLNVLTVGVGTLAEYALDVNLHIDQLLLDRGTEPNPGARHRRRRWPRAGAAWIGCDAIRRGRASKITGRRRHAGRHIDSGWCVRTHSHRGASQSHTRSARGEPHANQ